ncbi:MAG TPA: hypothetical protein VF159_02240 [Gemmatimonadaceae bacterium]
MAFMIDLTDQRLQIAANEDVIDFVRRTSPSAHGDVGSLLLSLGKEIPGARGYCPSYRSFAYVVLHTEADRIFAIAYGQRGLAFRINEPARAAAIADGGEPDPDVGADWVRFDPFDPHAKAGMRERLGRWCRQAFADAQDTSAER